ncbi:MAG TPA: aspartate aminotransferase family protein [Candidatus Limnocylindrales bacterium]|nr:aspartate aminotransferase family protein [Candidatus Limnocylindrales bacterium]
MTDVSHAHVFHSWSAQAGVDPMVVAGGEGAWFWDENGRRYLDFSSQLVNLNLGHQHPRIVAAIQQQATRLCTISPGFANDTRGRAARLISQVAPGELRHVFFTNGGADAVEHAIRMARLTTGRHKVLTQYRSYHGATAGAITLTGDPRRWASEPSMPGVVRFIGPYPYRSAFYSATPEQECARALAHLDEVLMFESPEAVAAILVETVVGTNGILVPPEGYLTGLRERCDRHGILLICDEVMSGFGRCGQWFAVDRWDVVPDLITFAKGVNSGYVPLGGVIIGPRVYEAFATRAYPGGLTYSGHPLACAAAVAAIETMREEDIVGRARRIGEEIIGPRLAKIQDRHPSVGEVRGLGMFWAIELVRDRATREMFVPFNASGAAAAPMNVLAAACKERGLWPFVHFNRVHVVPPLVTREEDLHRGLDILDEVLDLADRHFA